MQVFLYSKEKTMYSSVPKIFPTNIFPIQILLVLLSLNYGYAIECYICDSTKDPGCTDLKRNSGIVAEACTLEKVNQMDTWLTELARISYFHNGNSNVDNVPMICQKVIGVKENGDPVTARFCQIHTAQTDACSIPKEKAETDNSIEIKYCSVCNTTKCNSGKKNAPSAFIINFAILFSLKYFLN